MIKKATTVFLATLLFSSALPLKSFASEEVVNEEDVTQTEPESPGIIEEPEPDLVPDLPPEEPTIPEPQEPEQQPIMPDPAPVVLDPPSQEVSEVTPPAVEEVSENRVTVSVTPGQLHFEKNQTTEEFVATIGEAARMVGQEHDLFASVMIAQAILESGSGSSQLSQAPHHNLFGIKGSYEGQFVTFPTFEDDGTGNLYQIDSAFRQYPSETESLEDYAQLLTGGLDWNPMFYQDAWKSVAVTYEQATQALTGKYATDTIYHEKLNGLIETYNLTQYDHEKSNDIIVGGDFEPYNGENYDVNNSYAAGQCTQFVYNRIIQLGGYVDLDMGNGTDWGMTGRVRGYEVTNTPKAGTAVSFAPGFLGADPIYGHVSFVEKVNEDGSILISEMNVVGLGVVSTRTIPAEYGGMLTYVTPK